MKFPFKFSHERVSPAICIHIQLLFWNPKRRSPCFSKKHHFRAKQRGCGILLSGWRPHFRQKASYLQKSPHFFLFIRKREEKKNFVFGNENNFNIQRNKHAQRNSLIRWNRTQRNPTYGNRTMARENQIPPSLLPSPAPIQRYIFNEFVKKRREKDRIA